MDQKGFEIVFEISTFGANDEAALIKTLTSILENNLDTANCCPECFSFEPPLSQKSESGFYHGQVTITMPSTSNIIDDVNPIPWEEFIKQPEFASLMSPERPTMLEI